jgi:hypothetical protein
VGQPDFLINRSRSVGLVLTCECWQKEPREEVLQTWYLFLRFFRVYHFSFDQPLRANNG